MKRTMWIGNPFTTSMSRYVTYHLKKYVHEKVYITTNSCHSLHCKDMWCSLHYYECRSQVAWLGVTPGSTGSVVWATDLHVVRKLKPCTKFVVSSIITGEFDGYLLGDRGYPCQPSLLTLTLSRGPLQRFNVAHCRTRARVEMTIGILKSRFQCMQKLRITPERACDIIVACVLHNIAIIRGEQHPAVQINDPADDHPIPAADVQDGRAARELIARNYFWLKIKYKTNSHVIWLFFIPYKYKSNSQDL